MLAVLTEQFTAYSAASLQEMYQRNGCDAMATVAELTQLEIEQASQNLKQQRLQGQPKSHVRAAYSACMSGMHCLDPLQGLVLRRHPTELSTCCDCHVGVRSRF